MQILALNAGGSSLKFRLSNRRRTIAAGKLPSDADVSALLRDMGRAGIDAIGHRVVHGGPHLSNHTLIDDRILEEIRSVDELAPLHNRASIQLIEHARKAFPSVPMVAVFDTVFFRDLPAVATVYAIPRDLGEKYAIRRYGFHGLAHQSMWERCGALSERTPARVVTLQLGSGCSAAAIRGGKPIDTSMGFTPLEGIVMATRSGDLDPGLITFLAHREQLTPGRLCELLYERSGLLGISGISRDARELERRRDNDANAALALDVFCYRTRKYLGAFLAVLGGAEAIVFGGGIGQNSPGIRSAICDGMEWCGVRLNAARNLAAIGSEACISEDGTDTKVWVVNVDEERLITDATRLVVGID